METILTITEAAQDFAEIVNRAYHHQEATTLLQNGQPVARIVPVTSTAKTGPEIAAWLASRRPRLGVKEAEAFEADLRAARTELQEPISPWD